MKTGRSIFGSTSHGRDQIRRAHVCDHVFHVQERHHSFSSILPSLGYLQRGQQQPKRSTREQQSRRARLAKHGCQLFGQIRVLVVRAERHDKELVV